MIRHEDIKQKFLHEPSNATQELIPEGVIHVAQHGRVKTNWAMDSNMLNGCADRAAYLKLFARHGGRLDTNIYFKVYANQPVYVSWTTDAARYGWSLCILPIEMSVPDDKPAEFICAWLPSS